MSDSEKAPESSAHPLTAPAMQAEVGTVRLTITDRDGTRVVDSK